jgi:hypothetical protein
MPLKRPRQVMIYVSTKEYKQLRKLCFELNITVSKFVRTVIFKEMKDIEGERENEELEDERK